MNTPAISQSGEHLAVLDPVDFWKLNEPCRFPITAEGWDSLVQLPQRPRPQMVGHHSYDLVVNRKARRPATGTLRKLVSAFPEDFLDASPLFEPHEWRLLFYLGQYPASALANPSFDVIAAFHEIFDQDPSYNEVPSEWTGSSKPTASVILDLRTITSDMPHDVAKAAWSILGFARNLGLEKHEVLMVPWWKPWWIGYYLEAAR